MYPGPGTVSKHPVTISGATDRERMCINRAMTPVPAASRHKTRSLRRRRIGAAFSFAAVMSHVFIITFGPPGTFLTRSMENLTAACTEYLRARMISAGMNPPFISLVTDGVCTGTGSVLSFVPAISLLFLQLSILEHSRFMDIAAFALDGVMKKAGLSGAAAVPLLTGFGCSVPAVMASRRIPDIRQRMTTITLIPFMSCSAKLPVYMMFTSVFFPSCRLTVIAALYLAGILAAVFYVYIVGKIPDLPLLRRIRPGKTTACSTASPSGGATDSRCMSSCVYCRHVAHSPSSSRHRPDIRHTICSVALSVLANTGGFVKKAFTVIFMASVIIWYLQNFDAGLRMTSDFEDSILWRLGSFIAPVFAPLGFGSPGAAASVIAGLTAREATVSTLSIMSSAPEGIHTQDIMAQMFTPLSAVSFMVFCLLYTPCAATLAAIRKEAGSFTVPLRLCISRTVMAWIVSFIIFSTGRLIMLIYR